MANINSTTFNKAIGVADTFIPLTSVANINPNDFLFADREMMAVDAVLSTVTPPGVRVRRGVGGTTASTHAPALIAVYSGPATAFYATDPIGVPPSGVQNYWINTKTGVVWVAQGDEAGPGTQTRYWQAQTLVQSRGSLGIRTTTPTPTQAVQ